MLTLLFILIGLIAALLINMLADYLPSSTTPLRPQWASWRWSVRKRPLLVFGGTVVLFAFLPALIPEPLNLAVNSFHIAVLLLITVTDLEHRLIFNAVTYPATGLALLGSLLVTPAENNLRLALLGAAVGYVIFFVLYKIAQFIYGSGSGALGAGDVKLAMLLGAMLGFHRIFFALFLGILVGGLVSLLLLVTRRAGRASTMPYGQYLTTAGIIMLIWGVQYVQQYLN
jgi:leader peptidase (prepilin peptidase)/N-methyltransferase